MSKVVVITGASGGIGAATAKLLASRGMSVVLVARRENVLAEVARACGPNALAVRADVTERAEVRRVVDAALARFGHIDVWINNVGQGISRPPSQLTDQDIDDVMRLNVKSALYGMQEILPHFKERNEGHVINISSMLGRVPFAVTVTISSPGATRAPRSSSRCISSGVLCIPIDQLPPNGLWTPSVAATLRACQTSTITSHTSPMQPPSE